MHVHLSILVLNFVAVNLEVDMIRLVGVQRSTFVDRRLDRAADDTNLTHLPPGQNGRQFAGDIFRCSFVNENVWISNWIGMCSLGFNEENVSICLAMNKPRAIIWSNDDPAYRRTCASPGLNVLSTYTFDGQLVFYASLWSIMTQPSDALDTKLCFYISLFMITLVMEIKAVHPP